MYILMFYILFALATASPPSHKKYRNDYAYNSKSDAFYKLHIELVTNARAMILCKSEGADLMMPSSSHDIAQLHGMIKEFPDIGNYVWVGNDGLQHVPAEEQPIIKLDDPNFELSEKNDCETLTREGSLETSRCYISLPFICKVKAVDATFDSHCDVYGTGYKYYKSIGSCYKMSQVIASWNEAYDECRAEGSHLVVLNSIAEEQLVQNITNSALPVKGSSAPWFVYAGFRARKTADNSTRVFMTIFNQTLEEAGFSLWSPGEPNNWEGNEYCGTIFKNDGKYNDINCSHQYGYVCEKEIVLPKND